MLINTKRGKKPARQVGKPLTITTWNINNKNPRNGRSPKDTSMSNKDEETGLMYMIPLHWIPYVHFDV